MKFQISKAVISILILFSILTGSCDKQEVQNPVPNITFDVTLNLTLPLYEPLLHPLGGIVFYNAGSKGLAILRLSNDDFAVYDRHCPYNVHEGCVVEENEDTIGGLIDSDCCNSKFNMINEGFPDEGPAVNGLRPYSYTFNGTILRIFN